MIIMYGPGIAIPEPRYAFHIHHIISIYSIGAWSVWYRHRLVDLFDLRPSFVTGCRWEIMVWDWNHSCTVSNNNCLLHMPLSSHTLGVSLLYLESIGILINTEWCIALKPTWHHIVPYKPLHHYICWFKEVCTCTTWKSVLTYDTT